MPLGTEVGLGPGNIVLDLDGDLVPQRGAQPPIFGRAAITLGIGPHF